MYRATDFSDEPEVLRVTDLSVRAEGVETPILNRINLSIRRGETLCLVGESGSGKSVTSLTAMGLLPASLSVAGGSVKLGGDELLTKSQAQMRALRAARIAMIFQEPMTALNPVLRVGDQIMEVLELHGRAGRGAKDKVREILKQVHLPDVDRVMRAYPHQLSGGQRQRIMIAMALILEPALLIADEPTTALDVTTQKQILLLIDELKKIHGTAVLFITHDMGVVAEIADTVAVMRHGEIVETAPIGQLLENPREEYSRQLLNAVPSLVPRAARPGEAAAPVLKVEALEKTYGGGGWLRPRPGVTAA
ncbi:MAG: ABC transporter ATP-binding protein, partial [Paracoccus sp. (in: a-proteobacteria)]|nr:ABC transporter ATP-binding protein [Paracoccus sp. (in: a-proteobacteria)]